MKITIFLALVLVLTYPDLAASQVRRPVEGEPVAYYEDQPWNSGLNPDADAEGMMPASGGRTKRQLEITKAACDQVKTACHEGVSTAGPTKKGDRLIGISAPKVEVCPAVCMEGSPTSCPAKTKPGCVRVCDTGLVLTSSSCVTKCPSGQKLMTTTKCVPV